MKHQVNTSLLAALFVGTVVLLVVLAKIPTKVAVAQSPSVQMTAIMQPTPNATAIALEKAVLENQRLAEEIANLRAGNQRGWLENNALAAIPIILTIVGGIYGFIKWLSDRREAQEKELTARRVAQEKELADRRAERQKQLEDQFQTVVEGLASTDQSVKIGATITLRTFLQPGYEQFYGQVLSLVVAHLQRSLPPLYKTDGLKLPGPLHQALVSTLVEAYFLARETGSMWIQYESFERLTALIRNASQNPIGELLGWRDAEARIKDQIFRSQPWRNISGIHLELADLHGIDLSMATMKGSNLTEARLASSNLSNVNFTGSDLTGVEFVDVDLTGANLTGVNLNGAEIYSAKLIDTELNGTDFTNAKLGSVDFTNAKLVNTNFTNAEFYNVDFTNANLVNADFTDATVFSIKAGAKALLFAHSLSNAVIGEAPDLTDDEWKELEGKGAKRFDAKARGEGIKRAEELHKEVEALLAKGRGSGSDATEK